MSLMLGGSMGKLQTWLIVCALWAAAVCDVVAQPAQGRPVLVIPGVLGSNLCARATGAVVWGKRSSLWNVGELALPAEYKRETLPHVPCGLIESVNILGPFQVHQYDDLLATLRGMGYVDNKTLLVFPYDWRLSNRETAQLLHGFVSKNIPSGQFDIVAHSMGGIVAKLWMAEHGGAPRVGTFVTMGTPYQGSAKTFKTLDEGWGFWGNLMARGLGTIREAAMTWPSLYELLPSYGQCCGFRSAPAVPLQYFDPFNAPTWGKFNWVPASMKTAQRQKWLSDTLATARSISKVGVPSGPSVVPIVTGLIPTDWRVELDPASGSITRYLQQPGDGTVYQNSAANNQLVNARAALTTHQTIFADDASRQVLRWVLTRGPEPVKGALAITAKLRTASGAFVPISGASAEIVPPVLNRAQDAQFVVEITGADELAAADVGNVTASQEGRALAKPVREVLKQPDGAIVVRLVYPFKAPSDPGAFSVSVSLPGVAELPDVAVVAPN